MFPVFLLIDGEALCDSTITWRDCPQNLLNLVLRQQKAKFYQQMKDGKYVRVCRTDSARQTECARQEERMQSILAIVDRLTTDLPNLQPSLQRVSNVYGTTGSQDSLTSPTSSHWGTGSILS